DGAAVWVAGDSGALARIDAETWRHTDYTAPADITDNWTGVAVGGSAGEETILLVNGSGQVLRGEFDEDGPSWGDPIKPGSGSSISAVDLVDASLGYCCDTNDGVFETTDGGRSFERVGVDGASGTLTDVAGADRDDCLATADDGVVHRYDGRAWTPDRLHDDELAGIARWEDRIVACGEDAVFERSGTADDWDRHEFEDAALYGVAVRGERAIAVGEDGSVVARGAIGRSTGGR
ncbi:WD40/YVTN/BNR-like repeat-containing protein, partial [Natronoarchaeum mannanilyticum]